MKRKLNVLMVDDHPIIIEGYRNTLYDNFNQQYTLMIDVASNCDDAAAIIKQHRNVKPYDVALIDIKLPPSSDGKLTSGIDVAVLLRQFHPKARVIILTMHNEDGRIHNILQNINPEGFLIKSDLSSSELSRAFEEVAEGRTYYSATVNNHFRKMISNDFSLDQKNLQILHHLARGVQTKNLSNYINLSLSAIEKRKNHIKELFDIKSANDETLIEEARRRGFV
ncbi:MAG: response regulator transcription factor [Gilvibacter sp.]